MNKEILLVTQDTNRISNKTYSVNKTPIKIYFDSFIPSVGDCILLNEKERFEVKYRLISFNSNSNTKASASRVILIGNVAEVYRPNE